MNLVDLATRLSATTMFSSLPRAQLLALLERSVRRRAAAGDRLDGGIGGLRDHIVLLAGELELQRSWRDADGTEHVHARRIGIDPRGPGFELVTAASSHLRVLATADSELVSIDSDDLDELLGWDFLGAFVLPESHLKIFHRLPLENVADAMRCLVERKVEAGETVVTQGEPGDSFYVILTGEADVLHTDAKTGEPRVVNRLSDGDSFGEEALLTDSARTATVKMATPGKLLALEKTNFDALLRPSLAQEIAAAPAHDLVARGAARLLDCRHHAEHAELRIPGAQHLPMGRLRQDGVFAVEPDTTYIVYCRNGRRSRAATFLLRERGIHALSLSGGIAGWPFALEGSAG